MAGIEQVTPVIETKLKDLGLELFDVRFFNAGSRSILRITIDAPGGGVKISDCERVSSELSLLLDVEKFSPNRPYTLEISSPGIDRPLKTPRDYRRITGRPVILHLTNGINGKKTIQGEVVGCTEEILTIKLDESQQVDIELKDIYSGKEEIRFK
ncbi:MAG: ribosome maturation factor RimP [Chitinispirillaceae bacterium]|nr:ribosome maturation factor RimP [Chitinispirillaceae bacterium]